MVDEVIETVLPGGAWLTAGVVLGTALAPALRPIAVRALAVGIEAAERLQEAGAEAYEKAQDLVAEARLEREQAREHAREEEAPAQPTVPPPVSRRAARG